MQLVACQLTSSPVIDNNFFQVERFLKQIAYLGDEQPILVVLPECFALFGGEANLNQRHQETLGDGPIQQRLAQLAKKYNIWLAGGTIATKSQQSDRFFATLPVYNPQGEMVAHYQKIHLFDVDVNDNTGAYHESDTTVAGERVVVFDIEGITVGLAVCYDVRFAGLFQQLRAKGAQVVVLPSAFTQPTGEAHWHALLRARAIENQFYMVAAGQVGIHANGRQTYGHSMIVDAWGEIITEQADGSGWVSGELDSKRLAQIRATMPIQQHNRFNSEFHHEFCRT